MTDSGTTVRQPYGLTRPCANCPFRSDIRPYLTRGRVREIQQSLYGGASFPCHLTTDWRDDDDGEGSYIPTGEEIHCAGALIVMEKEGRSSQMMRIAERLGFYDAGKLDMDAPVYASFRAMIAAQGQRGQRR
jgi:hypothetical protein